jgi:hypothetical protein
MNNMLLCIEKIRKIVLARSPNIGLYVLIELDTDARGALDTWEKLVDQLRGHIDVPIFVHWTGKLDVDPGELGTRLGKIFAELGVSLFTLTHAIDIIDIIEGLDTHG